MRMYSLQWRPAEDCGEMGTFWLTALTNIHIHTLFIYIYIPIFTNIGIDYAFKSVNCPPAPVWAKGSATSSSLPGSALPCLWIVSLHPQHQGLGRRQILKDPDNRTPIFPLINTDTQYGKLKGFKKNFPIPTASHQLCQKSKALHRTQ